MRRVHNFIQSVLHKLASLLKPVAAETMMSKRSIYEAEKAIGPLTQFEENELAWPNKQFISIKHPSDEYARWAQVEDITDSSIKYIGRGSDCWLRLEGKKISELKPYYLGLVRSRGAYYIFEIDPKQKDCGAEYQWWNHPYQKVTETRKFNAGNIELAIYRKKMPVTIEGKNTDGVAIINTNESEVSRNGIIGSAPDCWITLPDPDLPGYMAVRESLGHHIVFYEYGYVKGDQYITRAGKAFRLGGYRITL